MKYLIVGLGNIGPEYEGTRHNIGFAVADAFVASRGGSFVLERHAFRAEVKFKGRIFVVIKPTTYMNLSGKALKHWMTIEGISAENSLTIVDDLDLDFGVLRMKKNGSGGSHNGLNHIIETLSHNNFPRLRFGIGKDFPRGRQVDYVLGKFSSEEEKDLPLRIDMAVKMIEGFGTIGVDRTMSEFNNK